MGREKTGFSHGHVQATATNGSLYLAGYVCAVIIMGCVLTSDEFLHWFVIPVLVCGALIGQDAIDWIRGRFSVLDPAGCLGVLGFHVFFLAPLLHVAWDQWMPYITPPPDWRPWLGWMAILNGAGLFAYRLARDPLDLPQPHLPHQPIWHMAPNRFIPIVSMALLLGGLLQLWVYQQNGGILGYISTYMESRETGFTDTRFKGMGILFIMSESFPILAMMAFALYASRHKAARSWMALSAAFLLYFVLLMLFGGLRGSRGNTLYSLVMGAGMIHLFVRPITKGMMVAGLTFLIGFMYVYGFYKEVGMEALTVLKADAGQVQEMEGKTKRTFRGLLLGDFGRSDVQAFILYRLSVFPQYYDYAWGRTYLGSAALLVPQSLWPERPVTKVKEGTEVMLGKGAHRSGLWDASNIYGLAGETMLNFGPVPVPFAFLLLGWIVKKVRRFAAALDEQDIRRLMIPFAVIFITNVLTMDSDNLLWLTAKFALVPFLVLAAGSRPWRMRSVHGAVARCR